MHTEAAAQKLLDILFKRQSPLFTTETELVKAGRSTFGPERAHLPRPKPAAPSNEQVASDTLVSRAAEAGLRFLPFFIGLIWWNDPWRS